MDLVLQTFPSNFLLGGSILRIHLFAAKVPGKLAHSARCFMPAALASVPFVFVLVRVRVRVPHATFTCIYSS